MSGNKVTELYELSQRRRVDHVPSARVLHEAAHALARYPVDLVRLTAYDVVLPPAASARVDYDVHIVREAGVEHLLKIARGHAAARLEVCPAHVDKYGVLIASAAVDLRALCARSRSDLRIQHSDVRRTAAPAAGAVRHRVAEQAAEAAVTAE